MLFFHICSGKHLVMFIEIEICGETHHYLQYRRAWYGNAYEEKRASADMLHKKCHRYPYKERSADALEHNELRLFDAIEIADKTEQETGGKAVDSIGLEIVPGSFDCV